MEGLSHQADKLGSATPISFAGHELHLLLVSQNQSQADLRKRCAALYLSYWLVIDVSMIQMAVWAGLEPACRSGRLTADWVTIPRTTQ